MKDFFNRVPFEYILAGFIISAALLIGYNLILCIVPLLLIALLIAWKINTARGIFLSLFLIMIIIFNLHHNDNKLKNALGGRPVYGTIQFEIIDPLCCSLAEIRNGTTMLIKIINIKTAGGEMLPCDGKFLVYAKDIIDATASYGDVFEINGTLRFADKMGIWNSVNETVDYDFRFGDFQQYMKLRNIAGVVYPDNESAVRDLGTKESLFRKILHLRDRTLAYVTKDLSVVNANLVGALFFGLKGALDSDSKQQFIKSGIIHLFSVSGLHVGILFALLLPLTLFLPVNKRYLAASILLIPFILTTGANVPAVRAFLMIFVYALLRCFCFYVPTLRILAGGCAFFLIFKADYLSDAGFLYSFGITGILLLANEKFRQWNRIWNTDHTLTAEKNRKFLWLRKYFLTNKKFIFALCSTFAAFAGGSIITSATFGYLYLSTVWVNFFMLFYSPLLIWLFIIKLIFTPIASVGECTAFVFDGSLSFMLKVIDFGANHPLQLNTVQIPVAAAILFYFALLMIGIVRNKLAFTAAMVFLLAFFPCAVLAARFQKAQLLVLRDPSDNMTAFVLADPKANYSWAYNIQNGKNMEIARKFLASKGINHLNVWIQYGSAKNKINALTMTAKNLKINKVIHISRKPLTERSMLGNDIIYDFRRQTGTEIRQKEKLNCFFRKKSQFGFEYFNPEAILPLCVIFDSENQTLIFRHNGEEYTKNWINSNLTEYFVYDI